MSTARSRGRRSQTLRQGLILIFILVMVTALVFWAGLPPEASLGFFFGGVALMVMIMSAFGFLAWHLLLRPLPAGHKIPETKALTVSQRRLLAVLVAISGINIVVGGFWDEVWHRQYGIPFGEDLFWRPHLLLYTGFALIVILAFAGLYRIIRQGNGTLQQRFRGDPIVGLLVLVGGFLIYALPADPVWHVLYGEDISAWSLPHMVLFLCFALIILLAAAIQLSTLPERTWTSIRRTQVPDLFLFVLFTFLLLVTLQVLATEWDVSDPFVVEQRPEWLLPALLSAAAALCATLALHASRLVGIASLVGFGAYALRRILISAFGYEGMTADPWLAILPVMVALDLWYAYQVLHRRHPVTLYPVAGMATLSMTIFGFPLVNTLFFYPQIGLDNLISMILASALAALGGTWLGIGTGDYLATANKQVQPEIASDWRLRWASSLGLAAVLIFITLFILTASPPV